MNEDAVGKPLDLSSARQVWTSAVWQSACVKYGVQKARTNRPANLASHLGAGARPRMGPCPEPARKPQNREIGQLKQPAVSRNSETGRRQ